MEQAIMTSSCRYVSLLDTESVEIPNYDAIKPLRDGGGGFYLSEKSKIVVLVLLQIGPSAPSHSMSPHNTPHLSIIITTVNPVRWILRKRTLRHPLASSIFLCHCLPVPLILFLPPSVSLPLSLSPPQPLSHRLSRLPPFQRKESEGPRSSSLSSSRRTSVVLWPMLSNLPHPPRLQYFI